MPAGTYTSAQPMPGGTYIPARGIQLAAPGGAMAPSSGPKVSGIGADTTTPSLLDRAKTFLQAENATVHVKNGYLLAGAAGVGLVAWFATHHGKKRRR